MSPAAELEKVMEDVHMSIRSKMDDNKLELVEDKVLELLETMEKKRSDEKELLGCVQDAVKMELKEDPDDRTRF